MAEYHRKIELQSPDDLQYLISNARRAATEKIDKDLPPIEGEDKMRTRVEELVQEYITTVFQTTSENITINGLTPTPEMLDSMLNNSTYGNMSIEEHEPFDSRLWETAKDYARQEEDLIEEIAALRRKMPSVAVENFKRMFKEGVESDEKVLQRMMESTREREGKCGVELSALERQEQVEVSWRKGVEGLERLKRTMPEMVAKGDRAERAEGYVIAPKKK